MIRAARTYTIPSTSPQPVGLADGVVGCGKSVVTQPEPLPVTPTVPLAHSQTLGLKVYEFSNHLGNVLTTFSDRKIATEATPGYVAYYNAEILSSTDYYPFGFQMPGRVYEGDYRYGFNSMEKDDEVKGSGNSYDFGARIYDPRVGRWLAVDPLAGKYPNYSPYVFVGNTPIMAVDPNGEKIYYVIIESTVNLETREIERTTTVLDLSNENDLKILAKHNANFVSYYQLVRNNTEFGVEIIQKYEKSETVDVYLTDGMAIGNDDTFDKIAAGEGGGGITFGSTIQKPKIEEDGTFYIEGTTDNDGNKIYYFEEYRNFEYVKPRQNVTNNFLISFESRAIMLKTFKEEIAYTILHEIIAHVDYAIQGIKGKMQHDKFYGKEGGSPEDYTPDSDHAKAKEQVQKANSDKKNN